MCYVFLMFFFFTFERLAPIGFHWNFCLLRNSRKAMWIKKNGTRASVDIAAWRKKGTIPILGLNYPFKQMTQREQQHPGTGGMHRADAFVSPMCTSPQEGKKRQ